MKLLDGETKIFPILGDPIAQVRSPEHLTSILHSRGENAIVPPMNVTSAHLADAMNAFRKVNNIQGFVITIPHKMPVLELCDRVSERAEFVGSVNIIRKCLNGDLYGDNVDGIGYLDGAEKAGCEVLNQRALLIGAGGAGSAVGFEILKRGAKYLAIYDIDNARLDRLITQLDKAFPGKVGRGSQDPSGFYFIANVTPVGMRPEDPTPVDISQLSSDQFVADAITKPAVSAMIGHAKSLGCKTMTGAGMFNAEAEILVDFMLEEMR